MSGANVGEYIIPKKDDIGIKGVAVLNPTFEEYMACIGKVIEINEDGKPVIIVKVI